MLEILHPAFVGDLEEVVDVEDADVVDEEGHGPESRAQRRRGAPCPPAVSRSATTPWALAPMAAQAASSLAWLRPLMMTVAPSSWNVARDGVADARGAARDDDDLALHSEIHGSLSPRSGCRRADEPGEPRGRLVDVGRPRPRRPPRPGPRDPRCRACSPAPDRRRALPAAPGSAGGRSACRAARFSPSMPRIRSKRSKSRALTCRARWRGQVESRPSRDGRRLRMGGPADVPVHDGRTLDVAAGQIVRRSSAAASGDRQMLPLQTMRMDRRSCGTGATSHSDAGLRPASHPPGWRGRRGAVARPSGSSVLKSNRPKWWPSIARAPMASARATASSRVRLPGTPLAARSASRPLTGSRARSTRNGASHSACPGHGTVSPECQSVTPPPRQHIAQDRNNPRACASSARGPQAWLCSVTPARDPPSRRHRSAPAGPAARRARWPAPARPGAPAPAHRGWRRAGGIVPGSIWSVWPWVQSSQSTSRQSDGATGGGIIRLCGKRVPRYFSARLSER